MPIYYNFHKDLAEKQHNLATDQLKLALSSSQSTTNRTNTTLSDITQISSAGYPNGGYPVTVTFSGIDTTTNKYNLLVEPVVISPTSGNVGPFRYAVLYNSTNNKLILYVDYGADITIPQGQSAALGFVNDLALVIQASDQP